MRHEVKPAGVRVLAGLLILRQKAIKPVLAEVQHLKRGRPPKTVALLDLLDQNLQKERLATAHAQARGLNEYSASTNMSVLVCP